MTPGEAGSELMPAAFIGHGNPMNALETNRYTQAWHAFGRAVPRPRAILVVSAHWYINATAVTAMPRPRDWAQRFDQDAKARMLDDPVAVTRLDGHRDFANAVPTPDHFLPLLYLAGLAGAGGEGADVLVDGYTYGSLSMTAYTIGMTCPEPSGETGGTEGPAPTVPPDASNI